MMKEQNKKYIVMTSIHPPTEAVSRCAGSKEWNVVVVGDKKTPRNWKHDKVVYLSPENQGTLPYEIVKSLPWNIPARAMVGYLYALERGAEIISQVDDDNIPYNEWSVMPFEDEYLHLAHDGFVNIYKYFTERFVWPRGYPLNEILKEITPMEEKRKAHVGIWQHLADKEADVDAIYRLTNNAEIFFRKRPPIVLSQKTICPFNCQSTTFRKEISPLLYLPAFITPRASDIVRGLIAQPLLWSGGYTLGFTEAAVFQERNPHDYMKDFDEETLIYLHSEEIFNIAKNAVSQNSDLYENLNHIYEELVRRGMIPKEELNLVQAWIRDTKKILSRG